MKHSEFKIGEEFQCSNMTWRTTDIGRRVIVAIRTDCRIVRVGIANTYKELNQSEAEAEGWFNGPPYAVDEVVFDENDMGSCTMM